MEALLSLATIHYNHPDWVFPPEASGELCLRLAAGEADGLSGRFIHVRDDFDAMIRQVDKIREQELQLLRLRVMDDG